MRRSTLILALILLASIGINMGLILQIGGKWHETRDIHRQHAGMPDRFAVTSFIDGTCDQENLSLNQDKLDQHLVSLKSEIDLNVNQRDLIGELIVTRANLNCALHQERARLHTHAKSDPWDSPERIKPFLTNLLTFRQSVAQATWQETDLQKQLVDSFNDKQLSALHAQKLPRLVPGLSIREFLAQSMRTKRKLYRRSSQHASP